MPKKWTVDEAIIGNTLNMLCADSALGDMEPGYQLGSQVTLPASHHPSSSFPASHNVSVEGSSEGSQYDSVEFWTLRC